MIKFFFTLNRNLFLCSFYLFYINLPIRTPENIFLLSNKEFHIFKGSYHLFSKMFLSGW